MTRKDRMRPITRSAMMSDMSWPHLVLPMKRWKNGTLECAILQDPVGSTEPVKLLIGNMFAGDFSKDRAIDYPSIDACIDDGWEVD